jgi:glycosyltransferase involved in cell wall biosynthesis
MKIALFTDTFIPQVNGVANTVFRSAMSLSDLGHEVLVCTISKNNKEEITKLSNNKIKILTLPSTSAIVYKGERLSAPIGLAMVEMKKFQPDIMHTHTPFSVGWEAVLAAKKLKTPLIGTHHTFFDHYLKYVFLDYNWAKKISWKVTVGYYNRCQLVISPTHSLSDGLKENGLKRTVEIVVNPVNTEKFRPDQNKKSGTKNLVYMGRVGYEKSIDDVIRAVVEVKKKIPDIQLHIVGDGPEKENLQKLANDLGLAENVHFDGFLQGDDLIRALQKSDIFLSGSKSENMPLSILEAMAVGLPIIAVSSLGLVEIVADGQNGFLTSPGNPTEMADKVLELFADEKKLKNFSEKSREMSLQYSDRKSAEKLVEIYEKLIKTK